MRGKEDHTWRLSESCRPMLLRKARSIPLVEHFAAVFGQQSIRVNAIALGVIETDMSSFAKSVQGRAFVLGIQAIKRI